MMDPELLAAGFDPNCAECREAVRSGREACGEHYVPVHLREDPRECPTCGGPKDADADACRRCQAAGVR